MTGPTDADDAVRTPDPRMIALRTAPPVANAHRHLPPQVQPQAEPAPSAPPGRHSVIGGGAVGGGVTGRDAVDRDGADDPSDAGVRPFVITHGRTAPVDERLRIETQVVAAPQAEGYVLDFECRRIVDLCAAPLSVAEIAAALALPIAVARVLVADLASVGALAVHAQEPVSHALLERVLERVHAL